MKKVRYNKIAKYENFIEDLKKFIKKEKYGYQQLQKGYTNITFREIFSTIDFIEKKIETIEEEIINETNI